MRDTARGARAARGSSRYVGDRERVEELEVAVLRGDVRAHADVAVREHDLVHALVEPALIAARTVEDARSAGGHHLQRADHRREVQVVGPQGRAGAAIRRDDHPRVERQRIAEALLDGLIRMGVRVDEAGHDDHPCRIHDGRARRVESAADGGDRAVLDEHVGDLERQVEVEQVSAADERAAGRRRLRTHGRACAGRRPAPAATITYEMLPAFGSGCPPPVS